MKSIPMWIFVMRWLLSWNRVTRIRPLALHLQLQESSSAGALTLTGTRWCSHIFGCLLLRCVGFFFLFAHLLSSSVTVGSLLRHMKLIKTATGARIIWIWRWISLFWTQKTCFPWKSSLFSIGLSMYAEFSTKFTAYFMIKYDSVLFVVLFLYIKVM